VTLDKPADVYSRDCPSRVVLDRIGDRWTALIVGVLEDGPAGLARSATRRESPQRC
jgi:DNA-binding HxlR family transcriptional regulator